MNQANGGATPAAASGQDRGCKFSPGYGGVFIRSCLVAGCATIMAPFFLFACLVVFAWFLTGSGDGGQASILDRAYSHGGGASRQVTLREGKEGAGVVAVVRIHGEIDGDGSSLDGDGILADVSEQFRAVAADDDIKVVLLQIDSPGGGLAASDQLHQGVEKLRQDGKIVLAWAGGIMASGGYYIAAAASGVMANPTATVGSIGVIMNHFQAAETLRSLGIRVDPITSAGRKDIGSPFREMTAEERNILQAQVDASHRRFVEIVARGRNMPIEKAGELASGDIFTAEEAMHNGLVDRIGYIEDALDWAEELAGSRNMRVIGFRPAPSWDKLFRHAIQGAATALWREWLSGQL
ncbi:MAG: signal peptide peptidase SppA [Planctomycetota bacterium]|jgi:protease-4|nr:signal peptide peptidase SppA [Planctomycetota bacterium]